MNKRYDSVYVDNCANCHITNDKGHFINYTQYAPDHNSGYINTIGGDTTPQGEGIVLWSWRDDDGKTHHYDLPG